MMDIYEHIRNAREWAIEKNIMDAMIIIDRDIAYTNQLYIQEGNGSFRLACNDDLESRLLFVKNAKYGKNGENVFSKSEFRDILCEFMDKDPSLNSDLLDDVWSKLYI